MKQEELEAAAEEFAQLRYDPNTCPTQNMMAKNIACKVGFKQGAAWQRNKVWHDATEKPKLGELLIVEVCGEIMDYGRYDVRDTIHPKARWAYIDDLLPTNFDEIVNENKDVLERLKKGQL